MALYDTLWIDARLATMAPGGAPYGAVADGALGVKDGRVAFAGPRADLPAPPARAARRVIEAGGRWILPGFVDCHTHLVFGGSRAAEFEQRLAGASYEEIARAGGGIVSTVRATRAASEDELFAATLPRFDRLLSEGVTTVEIKSGYGLSLADELKQLRVARRLGAAGRATVKTTLLAAHALPPEYRDRRDDYVALVCDEIVPEAARQGLADAVDAFCEGIAFTPEETQRVFAAAARAGLAVKLHADQLSDLGGAALAARHRALSADHLEYTSESGVAAMAASGTVAVLLPGAFYFLRETKLPPIAALRHAGVPIAIATDANPGSSPALSMRLMLNLACTLFRLTPEEALAGATRNGARALGLADRGTLALGQRADFALWDIERPADLAYWIGGGPAASVVVAGETRA